MINKSSLTTSHCLKNVATLPLFGTILSCICGGL